MISTKAQEDLLIEISRRLKKRMTVYAIGGTAMMFHGFKDQTLDIDLVFSSERDRSEFMEAAQSIGYEYMDHIRVYGKKENQPKMVKRAGERFDLFLNHIISFTFSESMKKRTSQTHEFGNTLIIKVADYHDIILMKCSTERAKDREDIQNIMAKTKIDWSIFIDEATVQNNLGNGRAVFFLFDTLLFLKNKIKIKIPKSVFNELWELIPSAE